jgi:hypothetical protein
MAGHDEDEDRGMTAFAVHRVTQKRKATVSLCENGCRTQSGARAESTRIAVFLGAWDVSLCARCAGEWQQAWDEAAGQEDDSMAVAA